MITEHHYIARKHVHCTDKTTYRQHMCGLCHALGDAYGFASRLLTTHDAILLNLLTSAQRKDAPDVVMRRCPLNPALKVQTNQDNGAAFAAAASVRLAYAATIDDIIDSDGRSLKGRFAARLLDRPMRSATAHLESLDFDAIDGLTQAQCEAEQHNDDAAAPTATVSAAVFEMTAKLANTPENSHLLASIGEGYGAYIYYADAYCDLSDDLKTGAFNPLRRFVEEVDGLNDAGRTWLTHQIGTALAKIRDGLAAVVLYRSHETLERLLTGPLVELMDEINGTCVQGETCACSVNVTMKTGYDVSLNVRGKRRKKRDTCCEWCTDCCYCYDTRNDGCLSCNNCCRCNNDCCDD
ncbi:MAG: DUF5685 family protein [Chloroflexota bacterium]